MKLADDRMVIFRDCESAALDGEEGVALGDALVFVLVPLIRLARVWNAAKLFGPDSTALIAKTIPEPQCPF